MTRIIRKKVVVTAQDVALLAGVSRSAVSRTFSNNGSVADATRQKILCAAETLGYQVNYLAQGLNRQRSRLIGVVVTKISDPFRSQLLEALLREIQNQDFQALVTEVRHEGELDAVMRRFTQYRVSGVIVTSGQPPIELVSECRHFDIPVVLINRYADIPKVDCVHSDNLMGARLAANQLIQIGCRHIGWVNYRHSTWSGQNRENACQQALSQWLTHPNHTLTPIHAESDGYDGGWRAAYEGINDLATLDGLFCATTMMACGVIDGLRAQQHENSEHLPVISFDTIPLTAQYAHRISTIGQDVTGTARQALSYLISRGQHGDLAQRVCAIPVTLTLAQEKPNG